MKLRDRIAVVIGAGQTPGETIGNGRAIALSYAREGATVVLADRDPQSLAETRRQIVEQGYEAEMETVDVLNEADCKRLIRTVIDRHDRIDILYYNVGRGFTGERLLDESCEDWDALMDVNLRGFFLINRHLLPFMRKQGHGVLLCTSSAAAVASGGSHAYKASKAGMNALVQSLAVSEGPAGIRVNAIMPGLLDTPMVIEYQAKRRGVDREVIRAERNRHVPLNGRMGTAWDVANAAVFLASDDAAYISGVILPVDGAFTARVG